MLDKEASTARSTSHQKIGFCQMLEKKYLRWSLYLGIYLVFSVQTSGSAPGILVEAFRFLLNFKLVSTPQKYLRKQNSHNLVKIFFLIFK